MSPNTSPLKKHIKIPLLTSIHKNSQILLPITLKRPLLLITPIQISKLIRRPIQSRELIDLVDGASTTFINQVIIGCAFPNGCEEYNYETLGTIAKTEDVVFAMSHSGGVEGLEN
jgi:hypothetical protein